MDGAIGYTVLSSAGERLGRVVDETGSALVVACRGLRARRRMLPKELALVDGRRDVVILATDKHRFLKSPHIGGSDSGVQLGAYWGHRDSP